MLTGEQIDFLCEVFAKVCTGFDARLVGMNGEDEDDHVHLLVEYPPKVAVSTLGRLTPA